MHGGAGEGTQSALPKHPEASTMQHGLLQPHPLVSNKDTRTLSRSQQQCLELTQKEHQVHPQ